MKAIHIQWDADGDEELLDFLPSEIQIPQNVGSEDVADWLSDETGYCHFGFELVD